MRGALAALQMTASLLLLVGAALFVRSAETAESIELGFDPKGVVVLDIEASGRTTPARAAGCFYDELMRRVAAIPGVTVAATSSRAPLDSSTPLVRVNPCEPVDGCRRPDVHDGQRPRCRLRLLRCRENAAALRAARSASAMSPAAVAS